MKIWMLPLVFLGSALALLPQASAQESDLTQALNRVLEPEFGPNAGARFPIADLWNAYKWGVAAPRLNIYESVAHGLLNAGDTNLRNPNYLRSIAPGLSYGAFMTVARALRSSPELIDTFISAFESEIGELLQGYIEAIDSTIRYTRRVNINRESAYLRGLKASRARQGLPTEVNDFTIFSPSGREDPYRKLHAFVYRRLAANDLTREEVIRIATRVRRIAADARR